MTSMQDSRPTEDTPTNPKVPDSIKGTGYYTPMDLVPEDTPTHVHISKVGENMCLECGERLPTTQDDRTSAKNARVVDTQLRKQIYTFFLDGIKEVPANPSARTDALLALFQKEQIQLVSELKGGCSQHSPTPKAQGHEADNLSLFAAQTNAVRWCIKEIDYWHGASGGSDYADKLYKGLKNKLRDSYLSEAGVDPAPKYPVQVNDLITEGLSQVEDTPSRPGEHKKQELEGTK